MKTFFINLLILVVCVSIYASLSSEKKEDEIMKVIRANDVKIEEKPELPERKDARKLVRKLVKIDDKYVQYVKAEQTENLIECEMHPFVEAVHLAYSQHLPLVISPDAIWYLISSGVAAHVNANAEALRSKFVDHEGKKVIKVRRDDFVLGSLTNPWHEVIDEFCIQVGDLTKNEVADIIQANFSTTTKDARVVSQIVLMDAMSKYFDYRFYTMCGIPEIRVSGDKSDWQKLAEKTKKIVSIVPELQRWMDSGLTEILDNFIAIFDDKVDKSFWDSIYKVSGGSGGPFITGWILSLFPYLDEGKQNRYVWGENARWQDSMGDGFFNGVTTSSFDYHMNQVPFTWVYYGDEIKMLFIGGMVGISASKVDNALVPVFGYAVTENKIENEKPEGDL